jgi:LacI family transcriptional regulator
MVLEQPRLDRFERPALRRVPGRARVRHVALVFPMADAHLQQVVRGIMERAAEHGNWRFTTLAEPPGPSLRMMGWQGDGVIAALASDADVRAAAELGLPCVNISSASRDRSFPRVNVDNATVGRLAAEHLLACGFRRVAYYGIRGVRYSEEREAAFVQRLHQDDSTVEYHALHACAAAEGEADDPATARAQKVDALASWLGGIQRPAAVFAVNDEHARLVIDACAARGLRVPEDVAVLGVDNDLVACTAAAPTLSSIACDWHRIGYEAAAALEELMDRAPRAAARTDLRIAPLGLVRRRSTEVVAIEHPAVAASVDFVRNNISQVFGVEALLRVSRLPRRSLEVAFRQSLGCTPYEYITRSRLAKAREMLAAPAPRQTLTEIAAACGFSDLRRFRMVFRRELGLSPAEYRARQQRQQHAQYADR